MSNERSDGDLPEPDEQEYREGIILLLSIAFIVYFEMGLKYQLVEPLRHKAEIFLILISIGSVHLLCSHLLAFLYNSRHLRFVPSFFAK